MLEDCLMSCSGISCCCCGLAFGLDTFCEVPCRLGVEVCCFGGRLRCVPGSGLGAGCAFGVVAFCPVFGGSFFGGMLSYLRVAFEYTCKAL